MGLIFERKKSYSIRHRLGTCTIMRDRFTQPQNHTKSYREELRYVGVSCAVVCAIELHTKLQGDTGVTSPLQSNLCLAPTVTVVSQSKSTNVDTLNKNYWNAFMMHHFVPIFSILCEYIEYKSMRVNIFDVQSQAVNESIHMANLFLILFALFVFCLGFL